MLENETPLRSSWYSPIQTSKERIISFWEKSLRKDIQTFKNKESFVIVNSLPLLLEYLVEALTVGNSRSELVTKLSAEHGEQRAKIEDCTLIDLVREYDLLRKTLFSVLDKANALAFQQRNLLLDLLDSARESGVTSFLKQRGKASEALSEKGADSSVDLAGVLEGTDAGVFGIESDYHFSYINQKAIAFLYGEESAYHSSDLIGKAIDDVPPALIHSKLFWGINEVFKLKSSKRFDIYDDASQRYFDVTIFYGPGRLNVHLVDQTNLRNIQTELEQSEMNFRSMVEVVEDYAIFMLDPEGKVATWNAGAEKIKRYKAEEILGQHFRVLYTLEDQKNNRAEKNLLKAQIKGKTEDEWWRMRKDGSQFWANVVITAIYDETGTLQGFTKVLRDLTERKKLQEQERFMSEASTIFADSRDLQRTLKRVTKLAVEEHSDWCIVDLRNFGGEEWDRKLIISHKDSSKEDIIANELLRNPEFLELPDGPQKVFRTCDSVLVEEFAETSLDVFLKSEEKKDLLKSIGLRSLVSVPLIAREKLFGVLTLCSSSPHRVYNLDTLNFSREFARRAALLIDNSLLLESTQKAVDLREEVVAIVSHDLKNPLNAILLSTELLKRTKFEAPNRDKILNQLMAIERSCERMTNLVSNLLDISKMESGTLYLEETSFPLERLFDDLQCVFDPLAIKKAIHLSFDEISSSEMIHGDRERIIQVFSNLIGNAIKFAPAEGVVEVKRHFHDGEIHFSISDSGPGIDAENLPYLFNRYWQAKHKSFGGVGLGLSIAKGIVEAHGGKIWVESQKGKGSVFTFSLPRKDH